MSSSGNEGGGVCRVCGTELDLVEKILGLGFRYRAVRCTRCSE